MKNDVWDIVPNDKARVWYIPSGSTRSNMLLMEVLKNTRTYLWLEDSLIKRELIMKRNLCQ